MKETDTAGNKKPKKKYVPKPKYLPNIVNQLNSFGVFERALDRLLYTGVADYSVISVNYLG